MQELYSKVTAGKYPAIPKHFSADLGKIIGLCLQTNPMLRPSAKELLAMPAMAGKEDKKKAPSHFRANSQAREQMDSKIELLQTIHMPRNMKKLKDMLPKKNYDPIEKPVVETIYSEKPMQKKGSRMEYESKLNYESDANALK